LSRNKNRVGGTKQPQPDNAPPQSLMGGGTEATPFSFVVPTEFVELPSAGRFYNETHPLHQMTSVEIRHMTAKEEDMLTSRTLLKQGVALDRVIQSLIVDPTIKAENLLIGDRNAIIIATRMAAYGTNYVTQVVCPACGSAQEYDFNLTECGTYDGTDTANRDITPNDDGTFDVALPASGVTATMRLLTGADEKRFLNGIEADRKQKRDRNITRQLRNIVVAVNGDASADALNYAVENLPAIDSRYLRASYRLMSPDIDLTQQFICEECDHAADMEVPLSADFFWPDQ
jgi:hypothetical protein